MGIISSGLVFLVGILLLVSLIVGNLMLTINLSLNYENVNSELVSIFQNSQIYWYYSLLASVILIALMFLLMENRKKISFNVGILMVISSLPLLFLNWIVSSFNFADILFSESNVVFWVVFILGIILVTVGIGLNFWKFNTENKKFSVSQTPRTPGVRDDNEEEEAPEKEVVKEKVKSKKK